MCQTYMKCVQCFTLTFLKTVNSFLAKDYNSILYFDFASRGTGRYIMQLPTTIELFLSYVEPGRLSTDSHDQSLSLIARASYVLFLSSSTVHTLQQLLEDAVVSGDVPHHNSFLFFVL